MTTEGSTVDLCLTKMEITTLKSMVMYAYDNEYVDDVDPTEVIAPLVEKITSLCEEV